MAHPRESWAGDAGRRPGPSRRFLRGGAPGSRPWGTGTLLEACAPALAGSGTVPLPRPDHPVTWPLPSDNPAIASNLATEKDATLQVYTWVAYINQDVVNSFAKKYKCKVQLTTFNTMNEALSKIRSGQSYDVIVGATVDTLGQLIEAKVVQSLNHSYLPNITQTWPDFSNPFYGRGWRYTVPYTIYHRHRVVEGPGLREPVRDEEPVVAAVEPRVQG